MICPECKGKGFVLLFSFCSPCSCQSREERKEQESTMIVDDQGIKRWVLDDDRFGLVHRIGDPAVVHPDGSKWWCQHGVLHREDGPAIELSDGTKYWYLNGEYHREDGPAMEYPNGDKFWYINGKKLTEEEFEEQK